MTLQDTIALIIESAREISIPTDKVKKIIADLEQAAREEKANREPPSKKAKSQFVILSTTPGLGYILQLEQEAAPTEAASRIQAAATDFNQSKKGRRAPVSTIGEALESVPARFFKTSDGKKLAVKTKLAVGIITVPNALAK